MSARVEKCEFAQRKMLPSSNLSPQIYDFINSSCFDSYKYLCIFLFKIICRVHLFKKTETVHIFLYSNIFLCG